MATKPDQSTAPPAATLPSVERIQQELATTTSIDDFFRKEGIFTRKRVPGLFAGTLEQMLEAELTAHLGYEPYAASGRNSGNSRNGKRPRSLRTSNGDMTIQVPRDRNSEFQPALLDKYQTSTNELEEKIIALYAKGVSTRDIQETLQELYGVEVSAQTISTVTDKVWSLVEAWQSRPLAAVYPIIYLDAIHLKLRRDGRVLNTAVYIVLGGDVDGQRDVLGHWVGDGAEGANFWLSVVTDLQARGVEDVLIACIDGLTGFKEAIQAVFPQTQIQRCIIHQVRQSLMFELVEHRFEEGATPQQDFVVQEQQAVRHIALEVGHQAHPPRLQQFPCQRCWQVARVVKQAAPQLLGKLEHWPPVVDVAGRELAGKQLALVINHAV